jgi:hypothetical protein
MLASQKNSVASSWLELARVPNPPKQPTKEEKTKRIGSRRKNTNENKRARGRSPAAEIKQKMKQR